MKFSHGIHSDTFRFAVDTKPAMTGSPGDDTIVGGPDSIIYGGAGNDRLTGDVVYGGAGNDILCGVTMTGGAGKDIFVFDAKYPNQVVTDYDPKHDAILFIGDPLPTAETGLFA